MIEAFRVGATRVRAARRHLARVTAFNRFRGEAEPRTSPIGFTEPITAESREHLLVAGSRTGRVVVVSEVHELYRRVADDFGARLHGVQPSQWDAGTPCAEWDVRALVTHVIATHGRVRATLGDVDPVAADADGDLLAQWSSARESILAAVTDPAQAQLTVSGMFGEQPFEILVGRLLCADTLFHTWDLARATGQDERLDAEASTKALEFLQPLDEAIRRPGGFGPKITPSAGADTQTMLLSFGGRAV